MSMLPYIIPILTVVSLFLYVFSAERAWLPKAHTTEWITRVVSPKRMTLTFKPVFHWKDLLIFAAILVIYIGLGAASAFPDFFENIYDTAATAVFAGIIYLIGTVLFENRSTALFAAAMTAADISLLQPASATALPAFLAIFIYFVLVSSSSLVFLLPAGIFLAASMWIEPASAVLTVLPLILSIAKCVQDKKIKPVLIYLLCCVLLPATVFCALSYFTYGDIVITQIMTSFVPPVTANPQYFAVSATALILLIIHIFKDRSFSALFLSAGLILCAVCTFLRPYPLCLFAGLAISYLADIIIKRGKKLHKAFLIIFGIIMLLPMLCHTVSNVLAAYAPSIGDILLSCLKYVSAL